MERRLYDLLVSLACHELRTPLTTISGYAQMIQKRAKGTQIASWSREIVSSSEKLEETIEKLLKTADARLSNLDPEPDELMFTALLALGRGIRNADPTATVKMYTGPKIIGIEAIPDFKKLNFFQTEFVSGLPYQLAAKLLQLGGFDFKTSFAGKALNIKIKY